MEYCSSTLDGWWKKWVMLGVFIWETWSSEHAWRFGHGMTRIYGGGHVLKWRNWGGGREWIHIQVVVVMMEIGSVELAVCGLREMDCISCLGWDGERVEVHVEYVLVCMAFRHTVIAAGCGCICLYFMNWRGFWMFTVSFVSFLWIFLAMQRWSQERILLDCLLCDTLILCGTLETVKKSSGHTSTNVSIMIIHCSKNNYHWSCRIPAKIKNKSGNKLSTLLLIIKS